MYFSETKESFKYRLVLKWSSISFGGNPFDSLNFLVPEKFRPQEIWTPRNLVPARKSQFGIFTQRPNFLVLKFFGVHISRGPNFYGHKWNWERKSAKVSDQNFIMHQFTGMHLRIYFNEFSFWFLFQLEKKNVEKIWWKHPMNLL